MNLQELFQTFGLFDDDTGNRIRWYETTAVERGDVDEDDVDYDLFGLSGFHDSYNTIYFKADAEVIVENEDSLKIADDTGTFHYFVPYRQVKVTELEVTD